MLYYLVSIVKQNDEDVLKLSKDLLPVKAAERVSMDMLDQQLREMDNRNELVKTVVKRHMIKSRLDNKTQVNESSVGMDMHKFYFNAASEIEALVQELADVKTQFANLLQFFGEDTNMIPEKVFCTINTFVSLFDQTHNELKRNEGAKVSGFDFFL